MLHNIDSLYLIGGGQIIRVIENTINNCNGFPDNAISWDGKVNGQQVQDGVYNARLEIKNCRYKDEYKKVKILYCKSTVTDCLDLRCVISLPPYFHPCGFLKDELCYKMGTYCNDEAQEFIIPILILW